MGVLRLAAVNGFLLSLVSTSKLYPRHCGRGGERMLQETCERAASGLGIRNALALSGPDFSQYDRAEGLQRLIIITAGLTGMICLSSEDGSTSGVGFSCPSLRSGPRGSLGND